MTATDYLFGLGACLSTPVATGIGIHSLDDAMDAFERYLEPRDTQRVVHLIGNGGSASAVAHAHNDLVKACHVRAMVYQDVPLLSAFANDHGYDKGYVDALTIWIDEGDVLIAVSSSGRSPNILNAVHAAKEAGAVVITLSGFEPDNPLRSLGDLNFYVPSSGWGHVELTHAALLHCVTDRLSRHA
jgi:D-sedoheptulose 7-phosphate isomerase